MKYIVWFWRNSLGIRWNTAVRIVTGIGQVVLGLMMVWLSRRFIDETIRTGNTQDVIHMVCLLVLTVVGGVVLRQENIKCLKENGTIIFLDRSPEDIIGDVDTETRPLLAAGRQRIYDLYRQREALYRQAADSTVRNAGDLQDVLRCLAETAESTEIGKQEK